MSTPIAMHSTIVSFEKNLHTNPTAFENKNKLYYLAAAVSGVAAAALLAASFLAFQTITTPFWIGLVGPVLTQAIGCMLGTLTCKLIQSAQEAQKTANCLKELQNIHSALCELSTYKFSDKETIIIPHCLLAQKKYLGLESHLQELTKNIKPSNLEFNAKEIITTEYQMLISKIDLAFKSALLKASIEGTLDKIIKEKDLLVIPDQNPLIQNQIRGLSSVLKDFSLPLVYFQSNPSQNLSYTQVQKMPFEELENYIFTVIQENNP